MHAAFGEDMDPTVRAGWIERRGREGVLVVCGICKSARRERVDEVWRGWFYRWVERGGVILEGGGAGRGERLGGEQTNGLGYGRLEKAAIRGVRAAVRGEDLAVGEEGGKGP